jgi:hypothetical protein
MDVRLDDDQRAILRAFRTLDPAGEYLYPWRSDEFTRCVAGAEGVPLFWRRDFESLIKRGLLRADGRGNARAYGITAAGLEAV